jgi:hypothetical protein
MAGLVPAIHVDVRTKGQEIVLAAATRPFEF